MNRPIPSLAVALLVLCAGCAGSGPPETETPTATTTAPGSGMGLYDCPYYVDAVPAAGAVADGDRTVAYANLSAERREEFDRMRENGTIELEVLPDAWNPPVIVTYEGERYAVTASTC